MFVTRLIVLHQSANILSFLIAKDAEVGSDGDNCENKIVKKLLSKNLNKGTSYSTSNVKQNFIQLKQAFIKALILSHFNFKYYIQIKIYTSGYAIRGMQSQLTNLSQWHLIIYFSQKMILAEIGYKTLNSKLLKYTHII